MDRQKVLSIQLYENQVNQYKLMEYFDKLLILEVIDKLVSIEQTNNVTDTRLIQTLITEIEEAGHVTHWRINPNIEKFIRCIWNFEAKVGGITGDIPVLQTIIKPFVQFIGNFFLHVFRGYPFFKRSFKIG